MNMSWKTLLSQEWKKEYFQEIYKYVNQERIRGNIIYPSNQDIFKSFALCPFEKTKVVIIGQDPYHNEGQAHGLAFSVPKGCPMPPSLKNIHKEICDDLSIKKTTLKGLDGDLSSLAEQGVFLYNPILTVGANQPLSHSGIGWDIFSAKVLSLLNEHKKNLVFLMWGKEAQKYTTYIDDEKHLILTASHPSPLSAHRSFFGCKHFSISNAYLLKHKEFEIDWTSFFKNCL